MSKCSQWIAKDSHFLLQEEIIFLKEKLYHVYDDLTTLFNRNHILQNSIEEKDQQLLLYKQQIKYSIYIEEFFEYSFIFLSSSNLKQSSQNLLHELDNRSIEEKLKRLLNNFLSDQHYHEISAR